MAGWPQPTAPRAPVKRLGARAVARLSKIPDRLNRNEAGVVWNGVSAMFEETDRRYEDDLQRILQAEYVEIYCEEYGVDTVRDLPYGWRSLRISPPWRESLRYDNFIASLKPLGLHHIAERLAAAALVELRARQGYLAFREAYLRLTDATPPQLKFRIALAAQELSGMGQTLSATIAARTPPNLDMQPHEVEFEQLDSILAIAAERMQSDRPARITPPRRHEAVTPQAAPRTNSSGKRIAIFVALDEERDILTAVPSTSKATTTKNFSLDRKMVSLWRFIVRMEWVAWLLRSQRWLIEKRGAPDLLLVTGLAGGFEQAKMKLGALLVPEIVFDLAVRKITADDTLFTPNPCIHSTVASSHI